MGEHDAQRRAAWRFVRAVIRSQSAGVVGAAISGVLWQVGAVAAPLIISYAIDHGVLTKDTHTLVIWLSALFGVALLEMAAGSVRHIYAIRNRARSDARVRDAIFAHALRLDASYHDRVGPGELMSRASSDSEHVARMMDSIGHTIGYVLTVFAVATILLLIDWELALIVLIPLPLISFAGWAYSRRYHAYTERLQETWGAAATLVEETVAGIRVVKGIGAGRSLAGDFRRRSRHPRPRARHARLRRGLHADPRVPADARADRRALAGRPPRDPGRSVARLVPCLQRLHHLSRLAATRPRPAGDDPAEGDRRERAHRRSARGGAEAR